MGNRHDASGQMSGYLYQAMTALWLLLKTENPDANIVIEKYDDIAFLEKDTPITMIQTKHQLIIRLNNDLLKCYLKSKHICNMASIYHKL